MKNLIDAKELRTLGRPIGKVADDKLQAFINEAEQLHVKPILGDKLYLDLLKENEIESEDEKSPILQLLLTGGTYLENEGTADETIRSFSGLKVAISYYVYAQNLMVGDIESTRYGSVIKDGDFSSHISTKTRSEAYNNTIQVANAYLKECLEYCITKELITSAGKPKAPIGGITIRRIG